MGAFIVCICVWGCVGLSCAFVCVGMGVGVGVDVCIGCTWFFTNVYTRVLRVRVLLRAHKQILEVKKSP